MKYFFILVSMIFCISCQKSSPSNNPKPTAAFSDSVFSSYLPVTFTFSPSPKAKTSYNWNFGDGTFTTVPTPIHEYIDSGVYQVTLNAVDSNGVITTLSETIKITSSAVQGAGSILFSYTLASGAPFNVKFINTSTNGISYLWDFGDGNGNVSADNIIYHNFGQPGTYTVKLITVGTYSSDSVSHTIVLK